MIFRFSRSVISKKGENLHFRTFLLCKIFDSQCKHMPNQKYRSGKQHIIKVFKFVFYI